MTIIIIIKITKKNLIYLQKSKIKSKPIYFQIIRISNLKIKKLILILIIIKLKKNLNKKLIKKI